MRKDEFLNELRNRLHGLPPDDIDNRVSFYNEMIEDRMDEGKSEEEAVMEIGTVDQVVEEIAKDTPLVKLIKQKVKPKRSLRAWEIVLLALGFPLWFPLTLVALILIFVAYLLIWTFVAVAYIVESALVIYALGAFIAFFAFLFSGNFNAVILGSSIMAAGGAILLAFGCVGITKATIKLSRAIILGVKKSFMRKKGEKK